MDISDNEFNLLRLQYNFRVMKSVFAEITVYPRSLNPYI